MTWRVGQGSDIHPLAKTAPLWLGGLEFPDHVGLQGHSDGDCLLHALIDALLGAACLGDIGSHFPDTDQRWKNADSKDLLRQTMTLVTEAGFRVENVDLTIHCKTPRLENRKVEMKTSIAGLLSLEADRVNVKAKSGNGLGPVGEGKAISADAIVLVQRTT